MAISDRLATARRTTLATCLCAALAASAGIHNGAVRAAGASTRDARAHELLPFADASSRRRAFDADRVRATANTIPVTSCADDGSDGTLRNAIESAGDGDTIDMTALNCSLITLQNGALVTSLTSLTLRGPGIDALTIDANNADRVLMGYNLDVSDLTMAHGVDLSGTGGGCVHALGDLALSRARLASCLEVNGTTNAVGGGAFVAGNLIMHDATITDSKASGAQYAGGGGALVGESATLYASSITNNTADASQMPALGGGLYVLGTATLHASIVDGNTAHAVDAAAYGGGMHGAADISLVDESIVSGNTASSDTSWSYGGGVSNGTNLQSGAATTTLWNSTVSGNVASAGCALCLVTGGGVHAFDTIVTKYSIVDHNEALCLDANTACSAGGGGVASSGAQSSSRIFVYDSTISTNIAVRGAQAGAFGVGGGVMLAPAEPFTATNTTIAFNHASDAGGGILATTLVNAPAEMVSTIVSNNDSLAGPDDISSGPIGNSAQIDGSANLVMHAAPGTTVPVDTLTADPGLLPLTTSEGGATAVHPLPAGSVAIDAGANPNSFVCDQRGYPSRRVEGAGADIGAFETGEAHLFADNFDGTTACQ